nr:LacI family DNA-binding transcriptional regulator [uncultured Devosia sp.]
MSETATKRATTAQDVADLAGVSISAVSRTFTPGASVSKKTRAIVMDAAEQLGYTPNLVARSLATQRSGIVGLVMGDIRNPYYPEVIDALSRRLANFGFRTMLTTVWGDVTVDDVGPSLVQSKVDGVIIASIAEADRLGDSLFKAGAAVVLFNRATMASESLSSVRCENVEGGRTVANYLLDRGLKRLAYIAGVEHIYTTQEREAGYSGRIIERGLQLHARETGDYTYQGGYDAARRLAALDIPPDSVFCANDITAIGAIDGFRAAGLRVPEDVSVVGFDDIELASWPPYQLTTVRQDKTALIESTVGMLVEQIKSGERARRIELIPVAMVERKSVVSRSSVA